MTENESEIESGCWKNEIICKDLSRDVCTIGSREEKAQSSFVVYFDFFPSFEEPCKIVCYKRNGNRKRGIKNCTSGLAFT